MKSCAVASCPRSEGRRVRSAVNLICSSKPSSTALAIFLVRAASGIGSTLKQGGDDANMRAEGGRGLRPAHWSLAAPSVILHGMTNTLNIALAQQNPVVGDVDGNVAKIRRGRDEAKAQGADLVIYGELNICGYPPEDLVLKPSFQAACESAVNKLAAETGDGGPALLLGSPWREDGKLYNAAVLLDRGRVAATRYKCDLPNYGVFDEKRVFAPSPPQGPVNFRNVRLGVMVCEDMWYSTVTECLAETGAEILMLGNGSPYEHEKQEERIHLAVQRVKESSLP